MTDLTDPQNQPGLLATLVDAATMANRTSPDPGGLFREGASVIHSTTHESLPEGMVSANIIFNCESIRGTFQEAAAVAQGTGQTKAENRMNAHDARIEALQSGGPVTVEDPLAVLHQGFVDNTIANKVARGMSEADARAELASTPQGRDMMDQAEPVVQEAHAENAGAAYVRRATIGCGPGS
ncbi:MAG: hypothetical protein KJ667_03530 [Alphaproteobacteria bacterium]|nr:hypothetical protein [Alphaproteobacteria bacterium]